jgi:uncharacterized membrane protein (DUF485 family)
MNDFALLISLKKKIVLPLLIIIIGSYFSFILCIAYYPELLTIQISDSTISFGIVFGFCLIILIFFITVLYVYLSNKYIEPLIKKIKS